MENKLLAHLYSNFPYVAQMYSYLGESELKIINKKLQDRNNKLSAGEECEPTFYDLVLIAYYPQIGTSRQKDSYSKMLSLLNESIKEYCALVHNNLELVNQLKRQLRDLFKINGAKYLDKCGELFSAIYLIKKYTNYELKALEYKFEKEINPKESKNADLVFNERGTNNLILVDIYNLNLDCEEIENEEGLSKLLIHRLSKKRNEKRFDSDFVKNNFHRAILQPFIWIMDIDTIIKYKTFWKGFSFDNTWPILCLRQRSDQNNKIFYNCVEIANIDN